MKKFELPPHIAWPSFVIVLLLVGIGSAFAALFAARSDGGTPVVDSYYQKAARWNETAAASRESQSLGWQIDVAIQKKEAGVPLRLVTLAVAGKDGLPVAGIKGTVQVSRPQRANPLAEIPFTEDPEHPGLYQLRVPIQEPGLWDFIISAQQEGHHFTSRIRRSVDE